MSYSISEMFLLLDSNNNIRGKQADLFGFSMEETASAAPPLLAREYEQTDIDFASAFFSGGLNSFALVDAARLLLELSVNAFDDFVFAWLSEEPVEAEILAFGRTVLGAASSLRFENQESTEMKINKETRALAEKAACNRGDENVRVVLTSAARVQHEVHRMMGLLRFSPNEEGAYIARCAPDHFILPAFSVHFTSRFGKNTSWAIIDEKRSLVLSRRLKERAKIHKTDAFPVNIGSVVNDNNQWEDLWRHYHKTINNESRNNPALQRQLMPKRYWKYLTEKPSEPST